MGGRDSGNYLHTKNSTMTQELQQQLRDVAEYDGWELVGKPEFNHPYKCLRKYMNGVMKYIPYINPQGTEYSDWSKELHYHTSYDWLMPVAKKVCSEISTVVVPDMSTQQYVDFISARVRVKGATFEDIENFFAAVHAAIILLNKYKTTAQ